MQEVQGVRVKLPRYLPLSYVTESYSTTISQSLSFFFFVLLYEREQS